MSLLCALIVITNQAAATPALIQSKDTSGNGTQITLSTPASAGNLLVVICGANASSTITGPSGFSAAINQSGSTSQGIFYKIAAGNEQTIS
jgi:hypothetical protein